MTEVHDVRQIGQIVEQHSWILWAQHQQNSGASADCLKACSQTAHLMVQLVVHLAVGVMVHSAVHVVVCFAGHMADHWDMLVAD